MAQQEQASPLDRPLERAAKIACPSPCTWSTLMAIAAHVRRKSPDTPCFPSTNRIAAMQGGKSPRQVYRDIQELEEAGIISVYRGLDALRAAGFQRPQAKVTRQQSFYVIRWPDQCHTVTGDSLSPVTDSQSTGDSLSPAPVTDSHKTGDSLSPGSPEGTQGGNPRKEIPEQGPVHELIQRWNTMAAEAGLPTCRRVTDKRRAAARERLKDYSDADIDAAIEIVSRGAFFRGRNGRGWRATIEWFLRPDTITKVLEGAYDDARGGRAAIAAIPGKYDRVMERARQEMNQ